MNITYDLWRFAEEPAESPWRRVTRIAFTPPLRDYIAARVLEMTSKWMFRVTTPMVVWQLTHDERMIAVALACLLLPGLVTEFVGGIVADRYERRTVLIGSAIASFASNVVIVFIAVSGWLSVPLLLGLTVVYGAVNSISNASSKTIVTAFVRKEDIPTAVSLNSVVFNVAGFVGPALAAGLIYGLGPAAAYGASALLTVAFAILLLRIPTPPREAPIQHIGFFAAVRDGLRHVLSVRFLALLFILHLSSIALTRPFIEFVPAIVHHAFEGGVREAGWMLSASGLGSITGGLWLASNVGSKRRLASLAVGAMPAFGLALLGVAYSPSLPVACAFAYIAGFGMITRGGAIQSMLQLEANPAYRGRVMALHGVTFQVGSITGAFLIGQIASVTSLTIALTFCVLALLALWLTIRAPFTAAARASAG